MELTTMETIRCDNQLGHLYYMLRLNFWLESLNDKDARKKAKQETIKKGWKV